MEKKSFKGGTWETNTWNSNYFLHLTMARESRLGNYLFGSSKNLKQGTNFVQFQAWRLQYPLRIWRSRCQSSCCCWMQAAPASLLCTTPNRPCKAWPVLKQLLEMPSPAIFCMIKDTEGAVWSYLYLHPKIEFVVKYWSNSKVNFLSISLIKKNLVCFLPANSSTHL